MQQTKLLLKVIILGDSNVGKSSLINRIVKDDFTGNYKETIGADFMTKEIELGTKIATLQIWDTAGQERFQSLGTIFYRGADACVLVYDLLNPVSFQSLDQWRNNFIEKASVEKPAEFPFLVLGNKVDLATQRKVALEDARKWVKDNKITCYFETSAKDATNVDEAFRRICREARNHQLDRHDDLFEKEVELNGKQVLTPNKSKGCKC